MAIACIECIQGLSSVDLDVKCLVPNGPDTGVRVYRRPKAEVEVQGSVQDILRLGIGLCLSLVKAMRGWNLLLATQAPTMDKQIVCSWAYPEA